LTITLSSIGKCNEVLDIVKVQTVFRMTETNFVFGWEVDAFTQNEHVVVSENLLLFTSLFCCCLVLQYLVGQKWNIRYFPEAVATILFSSFVGGIIRAVAYRSEHFSPLVLGFSSEVLYSALLPPIIFSSGYHLKRRFFYGNFGSVVSLAFCGTFITIILVSIGIHLTLTQTQLSVGSIVMTPMEIVAFACVLSTTDPVSTLAVFTRLRVDPSLYYAVLGESVLNDAVAITLFRLSSRLIASTEVLAYDAITCLVNFIILTIGSAVIGYVAGILFACVYKYIDFTHAPKNEHSKVAQMAVLLCTVFLPFYLADMLQLSGIVAIFATGIATRRYPTLYYCFFT
jgi:NhaP-type Na+/H+ or K+/H+ antiporter